MTTRRATWFKAALACGFLLGVLLPIQSFTSYRYVIDHLVPDHLTGEAGHYVSLLESLARQQNVGGNEELARLLEQVRLEHEGEIAWIRVADQEGEILAASANTSETPVLHEIVESIYELRSLNVNEKRERAGEQLFVVTLPFRFQFPDELLSLAEGSREPGRPRFKIAEMALYVRGYAGTFWALQRSLVLTIAAALALVASMAVAGLRFPDYLRQRQVEQQLNLARRVQQQLLPRECPTCEQLDFAAVCQPAYEVGGDYYDVIPLRQGGFAVVLGDVSGKGLPAALLMGLLQGAVRTAVNQWNGSNHGELTGQINELLYARTSEERYVTFFWAYTDGRSSTLHYVNAGHLPPLLVRRSQSGETNVRHLDVGGPVLGLLPGAAYQQGDENLQPGDLVILYSDGIAEATNPSDEEFGETGLLKALALEENRSASQVHQQILEHVKAFVKGRDFADDLTLVVIRIPPSSSAP